MKRIAVALMLALVAALAASAGAAAARPGPDRQTLLSEALLIPFKGQTEQIVFDTSTQRIVFDTSTQRFSSSYAAIVSDATPGSEYEFALSRRTCRSIVDKATPLLITARFGAFTAASEDVEIEEEKATDFPRPKSVRKARSLLLLEGADVAACGLLASTYGRGSHALAALDPTGGSGVSAIGVTREAKRRLRVKGAITCDLLDTCRRLMEDEGIFHFARQPCGQPVAVGRYSVTLGPDVASQRGSVIEFQDVMVSSLKRPATKQTLSWRVTLGGEELACGAPLG
jgi:hypothetical protein